MGVVFGLFSLFSLHSSAVLLALTSKYIVHKMDINVDLLKQLGESEW
jgi:hypothetical protein